MNVVYCAQFKDFSGYAIAARDYLKSVDANIAGSDFNFKIYPVIAGETNLSKEDNQLLEKYKFDSDAEIDSFIKEDYVCIWHMPSIMGIISDHRFGTFKEHGRRLSEIIRASNKNVNYLAWETDTLPDSYRDSIRYFGVNEVWVPSQWNRDVVLDSIDGVSVKVLEHVVSRGGERTSHPLEMPIDLDSSFVVYSSSQWTLRKGFDKLVKAFLSEFYHDEEAVLIVKTFPSETYSTTEKITNEVKYYKNLISYGLNDFKCKVIILSGYYPVEVMNWLYEKADIYASLSRGEGFGLTIAEAITREIPVLVPKEGGHVDYICHDSNYLVDGSWDMCFGAPDPYTHKSRWFESNISDAKRNLRLAFEDWEGGSLQGRGKKAKEYLEAKNMRYAPIGEKMLSLLHGVHLEEDTSLKKRVQKCPTLQEKVETLRDSYAGEDCYILTCGPSLSEYSKEFLDDFLKDKLVLSVKQAYDRHPEVSDFHFYNCSNLPPVQNGIEHYTYDSDNEPIIVASSNYDIGARWIPTQKQDLFFKVPIRTEIDNEFLCYTKSFEKYLLSSQLTRPCGPGIMLETVIYMAVHLGVKNIFALGWDLSYSNIKDVDKYKHFFGTTKSLHNRGDILDWEIQATREVSKDLFYWLKSMGIGLNLVSTQSSLYEGIPRVTI